MDGKPPLVPMQRVDDNVQFPSDEVLQKQPVQPIISSAFKPAQLEASEDGNKKDGGESKQNLHKSTVSWGQDKLLGIQEEIVFNDGSSGLNLAAADTAGTERTTTPPRSRLFSAGNANDVEEEDANARQAAHIANLFAGAPPPRRQRNISGLSKIDVGDIVKEMPMEQEAETYIVRAIEEREAIEPPMQHNRDNSGILSHISDDAISALSHHEYSQSNPDTNTDKSTGARSGAASGASYLKSRHIRHRSRHNQPSFHRRNQTMGDHLFGLTSAITSIHLDYDEDQAPETMIDTPPPAIPQTSATSLERNASLLYNRVTRRRRSFATSHSGGAVAESIEADASQDKEESSTGDKKITSAVSGDDSLASLMSRSYRNLMSPKKNDAEDDRSSIRSKGSARELASMSAPDNEQASIHLTDIEEGPPSGTFEKEAVGNDGDDDKNEKKDVMLGSARLERHDSKTQSSGNNNSRRKKMSNQTVRNLQDFFEPQKTTILRYLRVVFFYLAVPLLGIAAILFYFADCPPTGRLANSGRPVNGRICVNTSGQRVDCDQTSVAWWLLFAVRQLVTFTLAKFAEKLFVDFFTIESRITMTMLGPWATLFILQSRGWPSTIILWSIFNFCLLSGSSEFVKHWLYWQDLIGLFNRENPAGDVTNADLNYQILAIGLVLGIVVALKRLLLGMYLGRRTFDSYADQLANSMKNILMISEVSTLAKDFEREMKVRAKRKGLSDEVHMAQMSAHREKLYDLSYDIDEDQSSVVGFSSGHSEADKSLGKKVDRIVDPEDRNPWTGSLSFAQQQRIIQLLGQWEEPIIAQTSMETISVSALLQFRRSMACLNTPRPFGGAFGLADSREHCIQSAQDLYQRLLLNDPDQAELKFETLALLGLKSDGSLDQAKLKDLIRLFRPDREGNLGILEFVKSIDKVYKDIRLLRASVTNASKIDKSFETIVNWIFYGIALTIILSQLGYSPMALFLSISGVILAFAFMIGSASSKYFEGLLFILVRRPYAIGDGIHAMNVESEGHFTGHPFWYVQDVTLFTTSVMFMYTGETATLSNGSLANSRIVNVTRSPQAYCYTLLKFPVDVSLEKLKIFNTALEQFFRNRPREWRSYDSFRATRLDAQEGFIEYIVIATHRSSYIEWATVHISKAEMIHFCLELSKQLGIFYRQPAMPVELTIKNPQDIPFTPRLNPVIVDSPGPMSPLTTLPQQPDLARLQSMFPPRLP